MATTDSYMGTFYNALDQCPDIDTVMKNFYEDIFVDNKSKDDIYIRLYKSRIFIDKTNFEKILETMRLIILALGQICIGMIIHGHLSIVPHG